MGGVRGGGGGYKSLTVGWKGGGVGVGGWGEVQNGFVDRLFPGAQIQGCMIGDVDVGS